MLLRPFAAMNGCLGTVGADTGFGLAGAPIKVGTLPASGPSGIGCAGTTADAGAAQASSAATTATGVLKSLSERIALEGFPTSPPQGLVRRANLPSGRDSRKSANRGSLP